MQYGNNTVDNHEQLTLIFNEIMMQLSFTIVTLNREALITFVSLNISELLGYSKAEVIGREARDFLHLNDVSIAREHFEELLSTPSHQINIITKVLSREGQLVWMEINAKNLFFSKKMNCILLVMRVVDDRNRKLDTLLHRATEQARQEERHFIATELHDNINQIITATKLLIDTTIRHPEPKELLKQSSRNLTAVIEEIRKLSRRTLQYNVEQLGIGGSIRKFVSGIKEVDQLEYHIHVDEQLESSLTQDQKHHLVRIFQEAWNNTVKYAVATQVVVMITKDGDRLRMRIQDDGVGFDVNNTPNGVGLLSIAKRVKALNGHLHIQSSDLEGTVIQIVFPHNEEH